MKFTLLKKTKVASLVGGQNAIILIDGWSEISNHPIIGVAFAVNGRCYLANTVAATGKTHTSEILAQIIKEQKVTMSQ